MIPLVRWWRRRQLNRALTEVQRLADYWTLLAACWDLASTAPFGRTAVRVFGRTAHGLCTTVLVTLPHTRLSPVDQLRARYHLGRYLDDQAPCCGWYYWPLTPAGAVARAAACRTLARRIGCIP